MLPAVIADRAREFSLLPEEMWHGRDFTPLAKNVVAVANRAIPDLFVVVHLCAAAVAFAERQVHRLRFRMPPAVVADRAREFSLLPEEMWHGRDFTPLAKNVVAVANRAIPDLFVVVHLCAAAVAFAERQVHRLRFRMPPAVVADRAREFSL